MICESRKIRESLMIHESKIHSFYLIKDSRINANQFKIWFESWFESPMICESRKIRESLMIRESKIRSFYLIKDSRINVDSRINLESNHLKKIQINFLSRSLQKNSNEIRISNHWFGFATSPNHRWRGPGQATHFFRYSVICYI